MSSTTWAEALDRIEHDLDAYRAELAADALGGGRIPSFAPPGDLGALPHTLRPRAEALLAELRCLVETVGARQTEVAAELARVHRPRVAPPPSRQTFDALA